MKLKTILIILITGVVIMQLTHTLSPATGNLNPSVLEKIEKSPQYGGGKFINNGAALDMSISEYAATTWDFLFGGSARTPRVSLPTQPVDLSFLNNPGGNQLNVTWLGHSSLMINLDGYRILTDPVFQKRISMLGPTRFNGNVPLDINQLPEIDVVIISHDHYDHLNKYSVRRLDALTSRFVVPLAVGNRLASWGIAREKITELDWWEEYRFDHNLKIVATPSQHFSGRGLTDRNKTLWASWVVTGPDHNIFFSGDSGYFDGFKKIGEKFGPFDMTFMECGAYNEAWHGVHMYPEETVQAHLDLGGDILHPIHWGTFNLALHPWYEPMERLTAAARLKDVITATPIVGETTIYGKVIPADRWWEPAVARTESRRMTSEN